MEKIIVQNVRYPVKDAYSSAEMYFSLMSVVNHLALTSREIGLISYMAVNGSVLTKEVRDTFCQEHNSTVATVNNITCRLKKLHLLEKENNKLRITPVLSVNFGMNVSLNVRMMYGPEGK